MPGKNLALLAGHPLIAYSIAAARASGVFGAVVVSTDSAEVAAASRRYGAEVPGLRPPEFATSTSPDVQWVRHTMALLADERGPFDLFSILRPTSPFRGADTIRRALDTFVAHGDGVDSLRAVERCRQHPGKMWVLEGALMRPLLDQPQGVAWHSRQYQDLPEVYVQNSSLEMAWTRVLEGEPSIAGERVAPFLTQGAEGFTVDYPDDLVLAELMIERGEATLPVPRVAEQAR